MITAADMAPWGRGEPDEDGWYPDYWPGHPQPAVPTAVVQTQPERALEGVYVTWNLLIQHWRLVVADLSLHHGIDLYDPAVRARPWPGVRTAIFSLLDADTRLRQVLLTTRR